MSSGPISDNDILSTGWPDHTFSGTTNVWSSYGHVTAAAQSEHTGGTSSLTVDGAEGFGIFEDELTITSPGYVNGTNGSLTLLITVAGHLATTGSGYSDVEIRYQINGGGLATLFRAQVGNAVSLPFITSITSTGLSGFALSLGSMTGSGEVSSSSIPFVYGTSFVLKVGVLSYTLPVLTSANECDFSAQYTGIQVRGPGGETVTDFSISSSSGTTYGATGVTAVTTPRLSPGNLRAFPNPSSGGVELSMDGSVPADARVEIYDVAGRLVRQLAANGSGRGISWDGLDGRGAALPSGMYFVRMTSLAGVASARVTLVR